MEPSVPHDLLKDAEVVHHFKAPRLKVFALRANEIAPGLSRANVRTPMSRRAYFELCPDGPQLGSWARLGLGTRHHVANRATIRNLRAGTCVQIREHSSALIAQIGRNANPPGRIRREPHRHFGLSAYFRLFRYFAQTPSFSGRWVVTEDFIGTPRYMRLQLEQNGSNLAGELNGDKLEGTVTGSTIQFLARNEKKDTFEVRGTLAQGILTVTMVATDEANRDHPYTFSLTAKPAPPLEHRAPQRHNFTPTLFYRQFSALNKPVLTVAAGDTIHTTTVDAGGTDENNIRRVAGGNPETGPFYIEGAMPGDVLVVHINKLRLNRYWASSDDFLIDRSLNSDLAVKMKDVGKEIRWHLDLARGTASPEQPSAHLTHFSIPLKPMLGCIAAAPSISGAAPAAGDSGFYGGNMDFNEVGEGATVYLRISNPGALLYFGDGHAAQGDGELNGNALETSMEVELTVDVIPAKPIGDPRIETADAIITIGLDGSLDDAFKEATSDMAAWLAEDYKLTPSEISQVIGAAAEYRVSEAADRNAGVVLKLKKTYLQPLAPAAK